MCGVMVCHIPRKCPAEQRPAQGAQLRRGNTVTPVQRTQGLQQPLPNLARPDSLGVLFKNRSLGPVFRATAMDSLGWDPRN